MTELLPDEALGTQLLVIPPRPQRRFGEDEIHVDPVDDRLYLIRGLFRGNGNHCSGQGQDGQARDDIVDAVVAQEAYPVQPGHTLRSQAFRRHDRPTTTVLIGDGISALDHRCFGTEGLCFALDDYRIRSFHFHKPASLGGLSPLGETFSLTRLRLQVRFGILVRPVGSLPVLALICPA